MFSIELAYDTRKYPSPILPKEFPENEFQLGGGNQNPISSQESKQNTDNNTLNQNDLDDDIPF